MGRREHGDLLWREVADVLVVLHGRTAPTDDRWTELVVAASRPKPDGGRAPKAWTAVLIYSLGGMPTVTQRSKLGRMLTVTGQAPPVALVSESPLARGILTAVRWIFPVMRTIHAYAPEQRASALLWLGLDAERRRSVEQALDEMLASLKQA